MALPIRKPGNGSGGFLNGETAIIKSPVYVINKEGKTKKGNAFTAISVKLTVARDGAAPVEQFLNAGFLYGDNKISKDKKTIEGKDPFFINADTEYGKFATSLFEKGDNDDRTVLDEDAIGDGRSLGYLEDLRVTFHRQIDREATIAAGTRKAGTKAKGMSESDLFEAGKKKSAKDGKLYALDQLTVSNVLGYQASGKPAPKATAAKASTTTTASEANEATADAALIAVLGRNGGQVNRAKLSAEFLRYAGAVKMTEGREPLRKLVISQDYLDGAVAREIILLEGEGKDTVIIDANPAEQAAA